MTKSRDGPENRLVNGLDWLNFIEKIDYTIVDLFCRYKSDNNTTIAYTNRLER